MREPGVVSIRVLLDEQSSERFALTPLDSTSLLFDEQLSGSLFVILVSTRVLLNEQSSGSLFVLHDSIRVLLNEQSAESLFIVLDST